MEAAVLRRLRSRRTSLFWKYTFVVEVVLSVALLVPAGSRRGLPTVPRATILKPRSSRKRSLPDCASTSSWARRSATLRARCPPKHLTLDRDRPRSGRRSSPGCCARIRRSPKRPTSIKMGWSRFDKDAAPPRLLQFAIVPMTTSYATQRVPGRASGASTSSKLAARSSPT